MTTTQITAEQVLAQMLGTLPPGERSSLTLDLGSEAVPATAILDDEWIGDEMLLRQERWQTSDPLIVGTVLWRAISNSLVLPTVASSFITGVVLSPALNDVVLHRRALTGTDAQFTPTERISRFDGTFTHQKKAFGRLVGARSSQVTGLPIEAALVEALAPGIRYMAAICGKGERRLWSIAVDSIATRYLWAGIALGREDEARDAAKRTVAAISDLLGGPRLPEPRFQIVHWEPDSSFTFIRRVSCCLLYKGPHPHKCSTCPRQHPDERAERLVARGRRLLDR